MRKRFEQQMDLGVKPIEETPVRVKSRDDVPVLIKPLLLIYTTPLYNKKIFAILEQKMLKGKKATGASWIKFVANFCFSSISFSSL